MKININGYEIDIKARHEILRKKYNERDTLAVINYLAVLLCNSATYHESQTRESAHIVAEFERKDVDDISRFLDQMNSELVTEQDVL